VSVQTRLTEFLQDYARLDGVDASLFAERFLTQHARELAERIRTTALPEIHVDMFDNGTQWAANLIDPEATE
jgi:hypothetical protein